MARYESDREDLLREATAFVERIELSLADSPLSDHVTVGFRANHAASIFFGADPVYQFNQRAELRRAFCDGLLYKAVHGRLSSLRRDRQHGEVQLLRHDLSDEEHIEFLKKMANHLHRLARQLDCGEFQVVGQVPESANVLGKLKIWLSKRKNFPIANSPRTQ